MFAKQFVFATLLAASVYAQGTDTSSSVSPSASLTPCILSCTSQATQCVMTDASCVCSNTEYQQDVAACLTENCTAEDIAYAQSLQSQLCGSSSSSVVGSSVVSSPSGSVSSPRPSGSSSSVRPSSTGTSPSATGSGSGGSGGAAGLSTSLLATGGAILLGVIGGGMLVF